MFVPILGRYSRPLYIPVAWSNDYKAANIYRLLQGAGNEPRYYVQSQTIEQERIETMNIHDFVSNELPHSEPITLSLWTCMIRMWCQRYSSKILILHSQMSRDIVEVYVPTRDDLRSIQDYDKDPRMSKISEVRPDRYHHWEGLIPSCTGRLRFWAI